MADSSKSTVVFRALQLANEQRNAYGLRYNDYERYRKHCANRTHRLRSSLKMTHGKGRDFKKLPPLTLEMIKDGHLQLLMFEAERAWAYSVELNTQALLPANKDKAGNIRHCATGRFRRAIHWSTQLLSHCQGLYNAGRLSAENYLEVSIYTLILNGRFLRFRDDFEDALIQLSVARGLLDELIASASTSRDQALATVFADEIAPEIRYSAHELGRAKAYDVDGIVAEVAGQHRNQLVEGCDAILTKFKSEGEAAASVGTRKKLKELVWDSAPVPVRNPELVDVLLKVQEAEARLEGPATTDPSGSTEGAKAKAKGHSSKKGVAAYDAILSALSDAEDVARKLVEAQQHGGQSSSNTGAAAGQRDLHFVHAYIVYQLLSRRIQRDLLLLSALLASSSENKAGSSKGGAGVKLQAENVDSRLYPAVVKLLDTVLQSLEQMRTLTIVDDSPDLASAIEARVSYTKARRCLYLARCYAPSKRYSEALVLIQHANIHVREANNSLDILPPPIPELAPNDPSSVNPRYFPLDSSETAALQTNLDADALNYKRDWFAFNGGKLVSGPDAKEANKDYKKPVFFNIALNYVELDMDGLRARAGKPAQPPQQQQKPAAGKAGKAPASAPAPAPSTSQKGKGEPADKKRIDEARPSTPEQKPAAKGGLGGLLGGWWGRS